MRRTLVLAAVTAALLLTTAVATAVAARPYDYLLAPTSVCTNQTNASQSVATQEYAMRCMHNYVRTKKGLPSLRTHSLLTDSSGYKASDILRCQDFSHTACGRDTFYWTKRVGYASGCWGAGENIAWGAGTRDGVQLGSARQIMSAWLNSEGHRLNILNPRFRDKGVGLVKGRYSGHSGSQVWVTHFGYRC